MGCSLQGGNIHFNLHINLGQAIAANMMTQPQGWSVRELKCNTCPCVTARTLPTRGTRTGRKRPSDDGLAQAGSILTCALLCVSSRGSRRSKAAVRRARALSRLCVQTPSEGQNPKPNCLMTPWPSDVLQHLIHKDPTCGGPHTVACFLTPTCKARLSTSVHDLAAPAAYTVLGLRARGAQCSRAV